MITRVKDLQQELARFDGETRFEAELKIIPRGSQIAVAFDGMDDEVRVLDERNDELIGCIQGIKRGIQSLDKTPTAEDYKATIEIIKGLIIDSEAT